MTRFTFRPSRLEALTLLVILAIGVTRLPEPFYGNAALFTIFARALDRGAVLYVDIWDNKQPGIFLFYWLAGRTFGFTEVGLHSFELLFQLLFAAVLMRFVQRNVPDRAVACLTGLLTVGAFYLTAHTPHLGQVEGLVGLPILVSLALAGRPAESPRDRRLMMLGAGVAAGVVALFKLLLSPIPVAIWLVAWWIRRSDEDPSPVALLRDWVLPAAAGTGLILGATALWAGLHGGLSELLWASFEYPLLASAEFSRAPWSRLQLSELWFVEHFTVALALAACSWVGWRGVRNEVTALQAWAWLVVGIAVIVAQKLSFWPYQFLLLVPPAGLLAARGLDGLIRRVAWIREWPRVVVALLAVAAMMPGLRATGFRVRSALEVRDHPLPLIAYQRRISPAYDRYSRSLAFLDQASALSGPIYVFGDPLVLWLGHREQAGAINGWSWGSFVQAQWDDLPGQIEASRPAYVLVSRSNDQLVRRRSPATMALLRDQYMVLESSTDGTWYQRDSPE